jgi:exodeoxyribonuclease VII small subunit
MTDQTATAPEDITFEAGYAELKDIVAQLGTDGVPVHEAFEGLRRGRGLEKSLRAYLAEREGELTEIEAGKGLPEFNIVAPSGSAPALAVSSDDFAPAPIDDFAPVPPAPAPAPARQTASQDDDIPF